MPSNNSPFAGLGADFPPSSNIFSIPQHGPSSSLQIFGDGQTQTTIIPINAVASNPFASATPPNRGFPPGSSNNNPFAPSGFVPVPVHRAYDPSESQAIGLKSNPRATVTPEYFVRENPTGQDAQAMRAKSIGWNPKPWVNGIKELQANPTLLQEWQRALTHVSAYLETNLSIRLGGVENRNLLGLKRYLVNVLNKESFMKNGGPTQLQRCPRVTVDNFVFTPCYSAQFPGQVELGLVLGEFQKVFNGKPVHGWVVAGGGHYEALGVESEMYGLEGGDVSFDSAADKELEEELQITPDCVLMKQWVGEIDGPNDPRFACTRRPRLVYSRTPPKISDEMKHVVVVPLSIVWEVAQGRRMYPNPQRPDGKPLGLALDHDQYILRVLEIPTVLEFVKRAEQLQSKGL